MGKLPKKAVAIIVAHPDDEILWTGGTILSHPSWQCFIVSISHGNDPERSSKFFNALNILKSDGIMGDLDDGPEQNALDEKLMEQTILDLLPPRHFDLIITHNPSGEYTKNKRHEEVSKSVIKLWKAGKILTDELWTFAYEDGNKRYLPQAIEESSQCRVLTNRIWMRKISLILQTYGYDENSWEYKTAPKLEAFWQFTDPLEAVKWLKKGGIVPVVSDMDMD